MPTKHYIDFSEKERGVEALNLLKKISKNTSGGGEGGDIKKLTEEDYDYPSTNPTKIAGWNLDPGFYTVEGSNVLISRVPNENHTLSFDTGDIFIKTTEAAEVTPLTQPNYLYSQHKNNFLGFYHGEDGKDLVLSSQEVIDNCSTTSTTVPLSANQGKILSDRISALESQLNS